MHTDFILYRLKSSDLIQFIDDAWYCQSEADNLFVFQHLIPSPTLVMTQQCRSNVHCSGQSMSEAGSEITQRFTKLRALTNEHKDQKILLKSCKLGYICSIHFLENSSPLHFPRPPQFSNDIRIQWLILFSETQGWPMVQI